MQDRLSSKHLQQLPKLCFQKTSGSYCSNSNTLLLQVGHKTLATKTENSFKA